MSETLALPLHCPMHQEHQVKCQECHSSPKKKKDINIIFKNLTLLSITTKRPSVPRAPGKTLGVSRLQKKTKDQHVKCSVIDHFGQHANTVRPTQSSNIECQGPHEIACKHTRDHAVNTTCEINVNQKNKNVKTIYKGGTFPYVAGHP